MARKGFVISMDLIMAIGVVLVMIVLLTTPSSYRWDKYSYASDAVVVLQHLGIVDNLATMQSRLDSILPSESYKFNLIDFGPMYPIPFCSNDTQCSPPYSSCVFYICGDYSLTIENGEYQKYTSNPTLYCSSKMILEGSCKPEGDMSQRMFVELGDDDLIDNFYIAKLEVAE